MINDKCEYCEKPESTSEGLCWFCECALRLCDDCSKDNAEFLGMVACDECCEREVEAMINDPALDDLKQSFVDIFKKKDNQ